ncbi:diguanylate cyclase domain-containing protein [Trichlorobacter lovleyi]|uniref:diguanylate cyclase n=1 Tax=Trichlorobacter lovleyi (strain ATCC BAA-1151 / DSM 17278 / SZ) TaxID=398767 RepID=B3E8I6_TRIL1|nr:diguanylate cyclase [Trichlorobacter lovleyi]ACD96662.1 response regulator receiver modulated diguanylate cyclase [Trichlorobacter lovleyi SZ]
MTPERDGKLMILLVDDAPTNIQMLNETLKDGYHLFFATNGRDALRIASESLPDLILLDVIMPEMDGYEVCRNLKADPILRDVPIIFITAMSQQEDEAIGLELGAVDYIAKPFNPTIVRLRIRNQIELKRQRDLLARLSHLDGLTGIPNRRALDEALEREWRRGSRSLKPLSLLMIDIDHFKAYNDSCGHLAGDDCLRTVAQTLKQSLGRAADFVGRYGGEEFLAVLPETDADGAQVVAREVIEEMAKLAIPHPASPQGEKVTISIGIATAVAKREHLPVFLLQEADSALYRAKQEGRNRIVATPLLSC